jgi:hypothetical protein
MIELPTINVVKDGYGKGKIALVNPETDPPRIFVIWDMEDLDVLCGWYEANQVNFEEEEENEEF